VDRAPGDTDIGEIRSPHIVAVLSYLRMEYVPRRIAGDNSRKLTPRTVYHLHQSDILLYLG
jgi:hypothetical protein